MNSLKVSSVNKSHSFKAGNSFATKSQSTVAPPLPTTAQPHETSKTLPIVTSALALASLGVAAVAIAKKPSGLKEVEAQLKNISRDLTTTKNTQQTVQTTIEGLTGRIDTIKSDSEEGIKGIKKVFEEEKTALSGQINEIRGIAENPRIVKPILTRSVEVNGAHLNLGTVMHGYGVKDEALTAQLRAESTKRILGAVKPVQLPEEAVIRIPTAEYTGFAKTGGLAIVPKEVTANLGAVINNKQKVKLIADTPMYLGQVENSKFFSLVKRADGKFEYVCKESGKEAQTMATLEKVDERFIPIYTEAGKVNEKVGVYLSDEMYAAVDYNDTVAQLPEKVAEKVKEAISKGESYDTSLVRFTPPKKEGELPKAEAKFRTMFYQNDKFRMNGPVIEGKVKNIYSNYTTEAGETERFTYFGKFFYENLLPSESASKHYGADWIIGNDWHTGAAAAMVRLLTPAKAAMGEITPEVAEKVQNTPITILMHNFKLRGAANHSQEKLMNIMYGEHAAKIVENAWMPQKADLPHHLMNGHFAYTDVNPQTMAMTYADDVSFVSRGNFLEASTMPEKGGTNFELAALRGRKGKYADKAKLEEIAMASGIRPNEIPETPTAKGITNGCDRVNNIITETKARKLEKDLGLPEKSLMTEAQGQVDAFAYHQNNKGVYLNRVIEDVNTARATGGKENPLKIADIAHTDLTGVNADTMVFAEAGRIVDQKGVDIYAGGIEKFYERGVYDRENPPVFYIQGIGEQQFIERFLQVKSKVAQTDPKAANRIVFAGVFSEPGRYDGCKMMSDFSAMTSWDEPCGLVHKEIAATSGAIPVVNKVGGLTDGLHPYVKGGDNSKANAIFVDFMDKDSHPIEEALPYNSEKTADAFQLAQEWFKDRKSFAQGIKASFEGRYDWLRGKIQEYVEIGKKHGVISDAVDSHYTL